MARPDGPYLMHAVVCERVLQEADGVLSLIRIIDRMSLNRQVTGLTGATEPAPPLQAPAAFPLTFAISLRSGGFQGSLPLRVTVKTPSGFKWPEFQVSVFFEGDDRGANVLLPMQFPLQDEGLHWFVVELGGELLTRVPLRVINQTATQTLPPQL